MFGGALQKYAKPPLSHGNPELALEDSGLTRNDIEAAWFSNSGWGIFSVQHSIRGQVAITANGLQGIPITNVENACASGSTAFHNGEVRK